MYTTPSSDSNNDLKVEQAMISAFATPLVNYQWPDTAELNAALYDLIITTKNKNPGIQKSNVGGWHSTTDLLNWNAPCVKELRQRLERFAVELTRLVLNPSMENHKVQFAIEAWANVLKYGEYNSMHNHPNAFWSGCYYVNGNDAVDDHPFSGKLELIDPRPGASLSYAENTNLYGRYLLNPVAGQMIVFPSWLQHQVHPYFGDSERVSIAFNVSVS